MGIRARANGDLCIGFTRSKYEILWVAAPRFNWWEFIPPGYPFCPKPCYFSYIFHLSIKKFQGFVKIMGITCVQVKTLGSAPAGEREDIRKRKVETRQLAAVKHRAWPELGFIAGLVPAV